MIQVGKVIPPKSGDLVWEFWGVDEHKVPCAFLSAYYRAASDAFIILGIEVRSGWRGKGRGYQLYLAVQKMLNDPLLGDGFFTPRGWRSLQTRIPVVIERTKPVVPSTNFVKDWDNLLAA